MGRVTLPACLQDAKVTSIPDAAYYIADFITEAEEEVLLDKVSHSLSTCPHNDY